MEYKQPSEIFLLGYLFPFFFHVKKKKKKREGGGWKEEKQKPLFVT